MAKIVTLGEIMLRLSTTVGTRVARAHSFRAHYGGGEANVAISLANYGHHVSFASKVPENHLGKAAIEHLRRSGVDTQFMLAGGERLGTYYLEMGSGARASQVIYDRKGSSFAEMTALEWDIDQLFKDVAIFHISGITPALSDTWRSMTLDLIKAAKNSGCLISLDINYRQKLWGTNGCKAFLKEVLPLIDICSAGKLDAQYLLEISPYTGSDNEMIYYNEQMHQLYPNIKIFYSTIRTVYSASHNDLVGTFWSNGKYVESRVHTINPIVDRIGGGDAFAGGILHGILTNQEPQQIVDFATAASALEHTVFGDENQFSESEIIAYMASSSGEVLR
ncbi:sugar kinase [Enterococcus hermanniensis]|uniref:2-dehydro-3-deoxygluconokinase n=1 Tax=Enterococcus hermanniensis TaxID=249189 RepID=A0A1L8TP72_9ENTE|nr:sugar kinase [Enterococcus hermanniensis]OJG46131.1 2-dehydro-3-deoxygluconokinase [Enterococcus hermanniensis]